MKKFVIIVATIVLLASFSSCRVQPKPTGDNIPGLWGHDHWMRAISNLRTEYLVQQTKFMINGTWDAEQWMYGTWEPVKLIPKVSADSILAPASGGRAPWSALYERGADWVYNTEEKFSWNKPPFIEIVPKPNMPDKPKQSPYFKAVPSTYRHFFSLGKRSSGTLTIWVNGEVDIYMDPPVGTRLVNNPTSISKYYIGRAKGYNGEKGTSLNIPLIQCGTHALYFVHRPNPGGKFFGLIFGLETAPLPSQLSAGGWNVKECDCACMVSNETAEYLEHNDNGNNEYNGNLWEVLGTPNGKEWVLGHWLPVSVVPFEHADSLAWGVDVRGTPWHKLYNKGANWLYHIPSGGLSGGPNGVENILPGSIGWNHCPKGVTNVYRQTFTVDRHCTGELVVYTNDDVDVYIDPFAKINDMPQSTSIIYQGINPPPPNQPPTSYYYVGRADKQRRGMTVNLQIVLTPGTHTIYFVHRNSYDNESKNPGKRDYYGLLYSLCCKENCPCGDERDKGPVLNP